MKAKLLSAAVALGGLMAVSGTVLADAHDGYHRAFYGDSGVVQASDSMGKAVATTSFMGPTGGVVVLTTAGLAPWLDSASADSATGKAAFGASGPETNGYHRAFYGD